MAVFLIEKVLLVGKGRTGSLCLVATFRTQDVSLLQGPVLGSCPSTPSITMIYLISSVLFTFNQERTRVIQGDPVMLTTRTQLMSNVTRSEDQRVVLVLSSRRTEVLLSKTTVPDLNALKC